MALAVEFGDSIDPEVNAGVVALDRLLASLDLPGILETVPTYRSLLIHYEPAEISLAELARAIRDLLGAGLPQHVARGRLWTVPVLYGGRYGDDLDAVAARCGLAPERLIELHLQAEYFVYMIGFAPGFAYLGGLAAELNVPRRERPRPCVADGSIIIGGGQAGITATPVPTGWYVLGRTPAMAFDPRRADPFLFRAGDRIRFRSIEEDEYYRLAADAARGQPVAALEA
jgi:KipI family sensor histidine kinase inhibitor